MSCGRQAALFLLRVGLFLAMAFTALPGNMTGAQDASLPSVRGDLYESPSFGWLLVAPPGVWTFAESYTEDGADIVSITPNQGLGPFQFFISQMDDGRGSSGCADDMVDLIESTIPGQELNGWDGPDITLQELAPNEHMVRLALRDPVASANDVLVQIDCVLSDQGLLIASATLNPASAPDDPGAPAPLVPIWPGQGHTGQPRLNAEAPAPGGGVVRFLAHFDSPTNAMPLPSSCIDQTSFTMPEDLPLPGMGYLACDGQIVNVDTVPATIDLANIRLGCDSLPAGTQPPPECPSSPIPPTHGELLRAPAGATGSIITLQPGESAEVVLWYTLPEGDIPLDLLYVEPDRHIFAGETFFSAGGGSRPKIRAIR
jgi:hypothetical protein